MRKLFFGLVVVLVIVGLAGGFLVNELLSFRGKVVAVLKQGFVGGSLADAKLYSDAKFVRGVFLGFEKVGGKIGVYEYFGKAVFAGIDNKMNLFFYRIPLALKDGNSYYRPAQFWENSGGGSGSYGAVLRGWRDLKPGKTYAFVISTDVDKFFLQYDGGKTAVFESKTLERVYVITKRYVERHSGDLKTVYSGMVSPWRTYDIIEMAKGEIDLGEAMPLPWIIRVRYLADLYNAKI